VDVIPLLEHSLTFQIIRKKLPGTVLSLDGRTVFRDSVETDIEDDVNIGLLLANKILESGAQDSN
jgi:porphobilinogen deaminase